MQRSSFVALRGLLTGVFITVTLGLAACGSDDAGVGTAPEAQELEARRSAMVAHMQAHFDSTVSLPPEVVEALERGEVSEAEIEERTAAGEFERFFQFKTQPLGS